MSKEYLLKVKNLSCERNYKIIFNKLSFNLYPRNIVFIDGNNGSGKTTLLLCVSNILTYSGEVLIKKGIDNFGYVGHRNGLYDTQTVDSFLYFWKNIYNYKKSYHSILEYFNLSRFIDVPVSSLSFGQKKKLSFARLIMMKSKVWLLDEPISGLDKKTKKIILKLIQEHLSLGGGALATSHERLSYFDKKKVTRVKID
ncbi:MAG: heme ABC exporter ATP-binding protein CcmA [Alphaproteobacteria bacterium TMED93]|nr:MAG: heme ABC exporter ATP-binding protein CcmA [Alphaproteobacteria bacterium TMED93]